MAYLDEDPTPPWQKALTALLYAVYFIAAFLWLAILSLSECVVSDANGAMHVTSCAAQHPLRIPVFIAVAGTLFVGVLWLGRRTHNAGLTALAILVAMACWPILSIFL